MLFRHTLFNLLGLGLPLVVAVYTIPLLIGALGTEKFGLLTLIWAIVSYFGLFDLGLGRTLTLQMSVAESRGEHHKIGPAIATALIFMAALGGVVGVLFVIGAGRGVDLLASVPNRQEAVAALTAMGIAIPAITLTSGFRGILEARHAFGIVNLIRLPMGIYTFVGPLAAVLVGEPRLDIIAWVLVVGRYIGLALHAWTALRIMPSDCGAFRFSPEFVKPLFSVGGWLTVSNIVSPLMGYADRFIIGALVSATAVAYYATPYEIVTKLWIVPGALTSVLFPTFAAQIASDTSVGMTLFRQSVAVLALLLLPVCAGLAIFAHDILRIWIDSEFAANGALLLQIFALGVLVNSTAHVPFTLIQGAKRPKWTAMIQVAECLPFLALLWWATVQFGLVGAALAWLLRVAIDTLAMFAASRYLMRVTWSAVIPSQTAGVLCLILVAGGFCLIDSVALRAFGLLIVSVFSAILLLREPAIASRLRQTSLSPAKWFLK
jgi:O-antigen/teichoic acid export membrane protein